MLTGWATTSVLDFMVKYDCSLLCPWRMSFEPMNRALQRVKLGYLRPDCIDCNLVVRVKKETTNSTVACPRRVRPRVFVSVVDLATLNGGHVKYVWSATPRGGGG